MLFLWGLTGVFILITIIMIVICKKSDSVIWEFVLAIIASIALCVFVLCISRTIDLHKESIRQLKEREQIEYQIERIENGADVDKVKLNEWILTYNDWVNDVNTNKEQWGIFSIYYNFDMSKHTIIDLV